MQSLEQELGKEYLTEVMVTPQSTTVGLTLDQLDWAKRQDVTIVGVIREGERMPPNGWMKLHPGDALIIQGAVPTIGSLLKSPDFQFMEEVKIGEKTLRSLDLITVEALLSPNSRYTGRTMQQTNFGRDYGFSVLGISRHGQTIQERPSATRLAVWRLSSLARPQLKSRTTRAQSEPNCAKPTTLPDLGQKAGDHHDAAVGRHHLDGDHRRSYACTLHSTRCCRRALIGMRQSDGHLQVGRLASRCDRRGHDVSWSRAGENRCCGRLGSRHRHHTLQWAGPNLILGALLALTVALTQLIENAAVAIILAPIAYQIAREGYADPKPFMVGLAICISTSFCTPVAHETTMLVMGPGRYRFKHYLSIGSGMAVIAWLLTTFVTPTIWKF